MVSLIYLMADHGVRQVTDYQANRAVAEEMRLMTKLSVLVHALQQERGLTTECFGGPSSDFRDLLLSQYTRTDEILQSFSLQSLAHGEMLPQDLEAMRLQVADHNLSWTTAYAFYSEQVEQILSRLTNLARTSTLRMQDIQALTHLAWAREHLARIRCLVAGSLQDQGAVDLNTSYKVSHLETRLRVHLEMFRLLASVETVSGVARKLSDRDVQDTMELIAMIGTSNYQEAMIDENQWFGRVSLPFEVLRQIEEAMYLFLANDLEKDTQAVRSRIARNTSGIFAIGLLVVTLVGLTMRRVLQNLEMLASSVNKIIENRDFSKRIQIQPQGEIGVVVRGFNELLEAAESLLQEKQYLAYTDGLTGLPNRLYFSEVAHNALARKKRYPGPLALIMLDIDSFKRINDTFGHGVGDDVLRIMSRRILGSIRSIDIFARWGGEEFVILLPDEGPEAALGIAEKLRLLVESEEFPVAGRVTVSLGVAGLLPGDDFDSLCRRADQALYDSKRMGRNRVTLAA